MFVVRDFFETIKQHSSLEAALLWGPRQVGKTTLLDQLNLKSKLFLDDLVMRDRAQRDPALALDDLDLPCMIDEVQYAPNLFSEIKLRIDRSRREGLRNKGKRVGTSYFLTGSNRTLLDDQVKESLAGRCHLFNLHGFSLREIFKQISRVQIKVVLFKGGLPELYTRPELNVQKFLNDYILSFIEKDIAQGAGVEKLGEFHTVLRLLAARTGQFINVSEISGAAGVDQKTVQAWIHLLQRNLIVDLVPSFHSNLSKRLTKMKKLFFLDTGVCARLQGHMDEGLLWHSPQAGSLFETLVYSEIMKTRDNFLKSWNLYTWRTKEKSEIDFVLECGGKFTFMESKLGIHGAQPYDLDNEAMKVFKAPHRKLVITAGGDRTSLSRDTTMVPVQHLGDELLRTS